MAEFASISTPSFSQDPNTVNRVNRRQIVPGTIESRHLNVNIINRSATSTVGPISMTAGTQAYIVTVTKAKENDQIPLGSLGIGVRIFQGSVNIANIVHPGWNPGYDIQGPIMLPTASPLGTDPNNPYFSDGNDLVFETGIVNNTGSTQTIYLLIEVRYLMAIGGKS